MDIGEAVARVREQLSQAALRAGMSPEAVTLVAASKTQSAAAIQAAIQAGVDAVGENRCQELKEKRAQGAYAGAPLHFIGHLQQNKLRELVGVADLIQSVDSESLLLQTERRAALLGLRQPILLQVNIGREASKGGIDPAQADTLCALAGTLPHVHLRGLMAIPPRREAGRVYPYFAEMSKLFVDIKAKKYDNVDIDCLSMGMSGDYAAAVSEGANMIRIGTAIFGMRA